MDFKKTFEKFREYNAEKFIYDDVISIIRTDEELLKDSYLISIYDTPFIDDYCKTFGLDLDACNDIKRFCWLKKIQEVFETEHKEYIDNEIYFSGCSFKVYKKTYSSRLKEFKDKFIDADEIDFIKKEYKFEDENVVIAPYETLPITFSDDYYKNKKYSENKRQQFLETKIDELGYKVNYYEEDISSYYDERSIMTTKCNLVKKEIVNQVDIDLIEKIEKYQEPNIDLSDTKGTEKVIMLYKLGILDFLREQEPFKFSINALASAISGITGEKQTVIQSYINPIFSKSTGQKNNPLTTEKTVNKVTQKLISIGYNPVD